MIKRNIPNLFTLSNLLFGFLSIGLVLQKDYQNASIMILAGMMLDSLDGRLARKLGVESTFGKELDSLADIVTFGVAPAVLIYSTAFSEFGILGMLISGLFPVFGAIRLARFNVDKTPDNKYFTGVPITAAGGLIALLTIFQNFLPDVAIAVAHTFLCVLMVSSVKIPSLKSVPIPKYGTIVTLFLISLLAVAFYTGRFGISLAFAIPLYVLYMSVNLFLKNKRKNERE
ncbi:CDP-diacylglycerol--serine O-phosphatidyltransferase [Jeotgalibacillus proteolyticus]|uniref:CDP-diacylglycerol--serine O-phosphatidyltransferase n=1 Tax=Jeotgalibacillus proteolyticus TaxID=2082395 RepID=A0A2S5G828_9BACL|nr:CDP-diacylglycerol--serine O-phosphatidyltransferase [Jeotgalibacillus proteolyticus]PPA69139.1 CDP-diacylglycerol--serine O-phosphatidyltransferase [Jeotgalibacillus proteolyticus]